MKAVFLDRDSTLCDEDPKIKRVTNANEVEILPTVIEGLSLLAQKDALFFIVTNQAGIAEGLIDMEVFKAINQRVIDLVANSGIKITKTYVCPHGEGSDCECRKPKPTMLLDAADQFDIDLSQSFMVGDRETDVLTGINAGTKTVLVKSGGDMGESSQADFVAENFLEAARYIADQL